MRGGTSPFTADSRGPCGPSVGPWGHLPQLQQRRLLQAGTSTPSETVSISGRPSSPTSASASGSASAVTADASPRKSSATSLGIPDKPSCAVQHLPSALVSEVQTPRSSFSASLSAMAMATRPGGHQKNASSSRALPPATPRTRPTTGNGDPSGDLGVLVGGGGGPGSGGGVSAGSTFGLAEISGWAPIAFKQAFSTGQLQFEDRAVLSTLSESMADQLNSMFSFMHQVVLRERNRHSSNVALLLRKVDSDLQKTYNSVKEIFTNLTDQLVVLVKEVDKSRKQVKDIQDKYVSVREAAEAQSQYVLELEAVLDGQCAGVSDTLRRLNEQVVGRQQALTKHSEETKAKESKMKAEIRGLREEVKRANLAQKQLVTDLVPPALPEALASWTRIGDSTPTGGSQQGKESRASTSHSAAREGTGLPATPRTPKVRARINVSDQILAHCDAGRPVPRCKHVRRPGTFPKKKVGGAAGSQHAAVPQQGASHCLGQTGAEELRKRLLRAESRSERLLELVKFSSTSLVLLKDVFMELRTSNYLPAVGSSDDSGEGYGFMMKLPPAPAGDVLQRIVNIFKVHVPKLNNLPDVLTTLEDETEGYAPSSATSFAGDSSAESCGAE